MWVAKSQGRGYNYIKDWNHMFSYNEYRDILRKYKDIFRDFGYIDKRDESFCLIRHDVEFDVSRAETMAKIDYEEGIQSTFLFQVRSNAYNILSIRNMQHIENILSYGHRVGLHLLVDDRVQENDWDFIYYELFLQKGILEDALQFKVDRFSFHRPKPWMLEKRQDAIGGVLNLYGPSFFEFSDTPEKIKYYADSRHKWAYGHPLDDSNYKKFQLLIHPDEWSEEGLKAEKNFKKLIFDNTSRFETTMFEETVYKNNDR